MSSLLSSHCSFKRSFCAVIFYGRLFVKLKCFLNSVGNGWPYTDKTVKVSKQRHFLYTDKRDFQIRHFDVTHQVN